MLFLALPTGCCVALCNQDHLKQTHNTICMPSNALHQVHEQDVVAPGIMLSLALPA